jgi:hypothetical protein
MAAVIVMVVIVMIVAMVMVIVAPISRIDATCEKQE